MKLSIFIIIPNNRMNSTQFSGVYTALVTPMYDGKVSFEDLTKLLQNQVENGIDGVVAVGTTGESPTLNKKEHIEVIRHSVETVAGRVPLIAGTGANSTSEAITLTKAAHKAGADAMLIVAPYYNKPSQEGLFQHFSILAEQTDKPIILYSIPSRCGIEIAVETVIRLAEKFPNIRTIKEAGGSCDRVSRLTEALGDKITILSGDDSLTLPFMTQGAKGVISVASNLLVNETVKMVKAALENDYATASTINRKYYSLFKNLFIEPNPVPIKNALARAGIIRSAEVRMPLTAMSAKNEKILRDTLTSVGL